MDEPKEPRKPRKSKAPKQPKATAPESTPKVTPTKVISAIVPLTPEENKQFLEQIDSFLKRKQVQQRKESEDEYNVLHNYISEFLESFITFGYTFSGQRVLIQHHTTPKDKDAMLEFLKNVFVANASKDSPFTDLD